MSRVVVQKYGGSSVSDVGRIRQVAERVVRTVRGGDQVVVAVSAMGNTTNELLALARSVSSNPGRRELDLLVSVGERVSMTLLAIAIEETTRANALRAKYRAVSAVVPGSRWQAECNAQRLSSFDDYAPEMAFPALKRR